jgi:hypothetical protein
MEPRSRGVLPNIDCGKIVLLLLVANQDVNACARKLGSLAGFAPYWSAGRQFRVPSSSSGQSAVPLPGHRPERICEL